MSGLRAFCFFKATWQNAGSLASHRWHADSLETVGAEEKLWQEQEPDKTLPIYQVPTNTGQSATDHQLNSLTVP